MNSITSKKHLASKMKLAPLAVAISLTFGGVLAGCSSTDEMSNVDSENNTEYTLADMKADTDVRNATGDKSSVVAVPTGEEVDPSSETYVGATPQEEATAQVLTDKQELVINFAFDSAELTTEARKELSAMKSLVEDYDLTDAEVNVVGHADATGPDSYNKSLSMERADAVAEYLKGEGLPVAEWEVQGAGEADPVADNDTAPGRERNRRAVVSLIPNTDGQVSSTDYKF